MLRARAAGLDPAMRLDTWDELDDLSYDRELLADLATLRFTQAGHGVLVLGPVGVGKTHLATALGHIAIRRRLTVHAARADKLFTRLRAARLDNTLDAELRRLARVDLLILDDFALKPLDATQTNDFYELIVERHQRASTIVTSNREPAEWLTMMSDALLAQSAVDRLTSGAHTLIIEGPSYRQRHHDGAPTLTTKEASSDAHSNPGVPSSWQPGGPITLASDTRLRQIRIAQLHRANEILKTASAFSHRRRSSQTRLAVDYIRQHQDRLRSRHPTRNFNQVMPLLLRLVAGRRRWLRRSAPWRRVNGTGRRRPKL